MTLKTETDKLTMSMINCSALMDCVGCEKCRLWGKLQVLGLGTALKILFSVDNDNLINQQVCLFHIYWLCTRIMLIFSCKQIWD